MANLKDEKETLNNCGCGCDCDDHNHDHHNHEEEYEEYETMTLTLDDNTEMECIVLEIFDVESKTYIALLDSDESADQEVLIYEYKEIDEEEVELNVIETEDEFNKVSKVFEDLFFEEEDK